jgi:hypothetical protein
MRWGRRLHSGAMRAELPAAGRFDAQLRLELSTPYAHASGTCGSKTSGHQHETGISDLEIEESKLALS